MSDGDEFFTADRHRFRIAAIVPIDDPQSPYRAFFEVVPTDVPGRCT